MSVRAQLLPHIITEAPLSLHWHPRNRKKVALMLPSRSPAMPEPSTVDSENSDYVRQIDQIIRLLLLHFFR